MDYSKVLNSKIVSVKPSGIRKFFDIAAEMDNVISLSVGEPDFKTPWHVREEGISSLQLGKTWYTPNRGLSILRDEITKYYDRRFGIKYEPLSQVLVTVGGSEAIDVAIRCLAGPGDEVIIPQPSFVCYEPLTEMAGATPVLMDTKVENEFRIVPEDLEKAITDKTKLLILPYPNNPTGGIMEKKDLEAIAEVIKKHDLMVLSDEIYAELTYTKDKHVSIANIDGMYERTIVVNGFSKTYAMTGWRLGYALGPKEIIAQMTKLHQFCIMSAPTTAQYAAIEALRHGDDDIESMKDEYEMRKHFIVGSFDKLGLDCFEPKGAFYCFPCIKSTGLSSEEFCTRLIKEKHVAVVPGNAFGECGEGFIRVSYCNSLKNIAEAMRRIEEFLVELKDGNKG
ncbi:MAG: aminotransferase class I/II-fold pyridoxal phosphate-dependent enzyme [Ruminococcus sp.]|nr:aminotransferase class I/II-fold pyridoxal phosphate-dependent enzyme [Ruminococcus sp.]MCI6506097.1 aminotransferase class I/II-fold pyridoxal phosphate-dependent enzyme [Ruminococcus sp.]MDD6531182.1 aminotransferase class I/II-fold pyridoxal phosphate-dependent enzyme [Ruminococcus sp.]